MIHPIILAFLGEHLADLENPKPYINNDIVYVDCSEGNSAEILSHMLQGLDYDYGYTKPCQHKCWDNMPYVMVNRKTGLYSGSKGMACGQEWMPFDDLKCSVLEKTKKPFTDDEMARVKDIIAHKVRERKQWIENRTSQVHELDMLDNCLDKVKTRNSFQNIRDEVHKI